jgi:hypothetical protein
VFLFHGFDGSGTYEAAGLFTADGDGSILNGTEDINRLSGPRTLSFTGSYDVGADNRGTFTITTASGSSTFAFALNPTGEIAWFTEFDNSAVSGSGVIKAQDPPQFSDASFNGSYALGLNGEDFAGNRIGALGAIFADGSGAIDGSGLDVVDGGSALPPVSNFTGSYSIGGDGRGTAQLQAALFGGATLHFSVYIVSAHEAFFLSTDPASATSPIFGGEALQQSGSPFSDASLHGPAIFTQSGLSNGSADVSIGLVSFDANGNIAGEFDENNGGIITTEAQLTGTYVAQSNGRTVLNLVNVKTQTVTSLVAYLIAPNSAFLLNRGAGVQVGTLKPQQITAPFGNSFLAGTFTFAPDAVANSTAILATGVGTFDGTGGQAGLVGTEDSSQNSGTKPNLPVVGTYSVSAVSNNGRGVANLTSPGTQMIAFWMVSFSEVVGIDVDAGYQNPTLVIFEQQ